MIRIKKTRWYSNRLENQQKHENVQFVGIVIDW